VRVRDGRLLTDRQVAALAAGHLASGVEGVPMADLLATVMLLRERRQEDALRTFLSEHSSLCMDDERDQETLAAALRQWLGGES